MDWANINASLVKNFHRELVGSISELGKLSGDQYQSSWRPHVLRCSNPDSIQLKSPDPLSTVFESYFQRVQGSFCWYTFTLFVFIHSETTFSNLKQRLERRIPHEFWSNLFETNWLRSQKWSLWERQIERFFVRAMNLRKGNILEITNTGTPWRTLGFMEFLIPNQGKGFPHAFPKIVLNGSVTL